MLLLKVGDRVRDNIDIVHEVNTNCPGLYFGGYVVDCFPWGSPTPKDHVRIDTNNDIIYRNGGFTVVDDKI